MRAGLLHHGLEQAPDRLPDRVAIRAGDDEWTFGRLDREADALAAVLAGKGVGALVATRILGLPAS
jgi:non-ribosomal peptide synthetase component E (peptide arylation enzyme)